MVSSLNALNFWRGVNSEKFCKLNAMALSLLSAHILASRSAVFEMKGTDSSVEMNGARLQASCPNSDTSPTFSLRSTLFLDRSSVTIDLHDVLNSCANVAVTKACVELSQRVPRSPMFHCAFTDSTGTTLSTVKTHAKLEEYRLSMGELYRVAPILDCPPISGGSAYEGNLSVFFNDQQLTISGKSPGPQITFAPFVVLYTAVLSGSVDDFDGDGYRQQLASYLGVAATVVSLNYYSASVVVEAIVIFSDAKAAQNAVATLQVSGTVSAALGVDIVSAEAPTLTLSETGWDVTISGFITKVVDKWCAGGSKSSYSSTIVQTAAETVIDMRNKCALQCLQDGICTGIAVRSTGQTCYLYTMTYEICLANTAAATPRPIAIPVQYDSPGWIMHFKVLGPVSAVGFKQTPPMICQLEPLVNCICLLLPCNSSSHVLN